MEFIQSCVALVMYGLVQAALGGGVRAPNPPPPQLSCSKCGDLMCASGWCHRCRGIRVASPPPPPPKR